MFHVNTETSEIVGIVLGDGNIFVSGGRHTVTVTLHKKEIRYTKLTSKMKGLIDTDGSVYRLAPHWPNLIQISFKNNNKRLLKGVRLALIKLGFNTSKVFGNRVVMTRKQDVEKYFREIGTNNLRLAL